MKYLISLLFVVSIYSSIKGQIRGNGTMGSLSQEVRNLNIIDIQFNANVILDYYQEEVMTIHAEENIIDFIAIAFDNGQLKIDQKKWIEPTIQPVIKIGCPNLKTIFQGTHSTSHVKNVNGSQVVLQGNVGKIVISGNVDTLLIETTRTKVDAKRLNCQNVIVGKDCKSSIILDEYNDLTINNNAEPNIKNLDLSKSVSTTNERNKLTEEVTFIKFKIKNNSFKLNSFYVTGPNARGGNFSYGFSMFPFKSKKENWSVGTKIYKTSRSGQLTELVVIKKEDEGKTLNLFD